MADQQPGSAPAPPTSEEGGKLAGTWKLVSVRRSNGVVVDQPNAQGLIMYDHSGNMSAQIVLPPDPVSSGQPSGYSAYFGSYSIDEAASTVTHHRLANTDPSRPTDVVRRFEFDREGRLTLQPQEHIGDQLTFERIG